MITNRELSFDDYLSMLRRRLWVILVPILIAPAIGFAVSYLFDAKYTASTTVLIEEPKVPGDLVKPIITEDVLRRITGLEQQVLSRNHLVPVVQRLGLAKSDGQAVQVADQVRSSVDITPVQDSTSTTSKKKSQPSNSSDIPGFNVNLTYSDPRVAQQLCNQVTDMLITENLKAREQVAQGTTDFLAHQVDDAKHNLDEQDAKLATFQRQYVGQLPEDADSNLKVLMGLNSQLDAATQAINRAQADKSYAQSLLAQQLASWRASESSTSPQALQQQLTTLQGQLLQLQSRYTDDYPDVVKTKASIKEVEGKLKQVDSAKPDTSNAKADASEPPEIRQLRVQIHQYEQTIDQAEEQQKRLQDQIKLYQGRVALSPAVEEQYKQLTRDYQSAQKFYDDLLAKKSQSEMATDLERQQQGEQFRLLNPASLPSSPSFPNRLLFAGGGLGAGLALGCALGFWLEFQDKAIRNELDVEAVMDLPALISIPWVLETEEGNRNGSRGEPAHARSSGERERVGV
ncbi:MAG TPA: Wzz/FepE/Etk N-terminal domain-containing protein [Terriglobales bacterium]